MADLGCIRNGKIMICCSWEDSFNPSTCCMIKWFGVLVVSDTGRKYCLKDGYEWNYMYLLFASQERKINVMRKCQIQTRFTLDTDIKRSSCCGSCHYWQFTQCGHRVSHCVTYTIFVKQFDVENIHVYHVFWWLISLFLILWLYLDEWESQRVWISFVTNLWIVPQSDPCTKHFNCCCILLLLKRTRLSMIRKYINLLRNKTSFTFKLNR